MVYSSIIITIYMEDGDCVIIISDTELVKRKRSPFVRYARSLAITGLRESKIRIV